METEKGELLQKEEEEAATLSIIEIEENPSLTYTYEDVLVYFPCF